MSTRDSSSGPQERRRVRSAVRITGGSSRPRRPRADASRSHAGHDVEQLAGRARAVVEAGQAADRAGVDAFFADDLGGLDPYPLLAAVAEVTEELLLGSLGEPVGRRAPSVLAKLATTLDVVSNGRALLGLTPTHSTTTSGLVDALEICRAMACRPAPSYPGAVYAVYGAWNEPRFAGARPLPVALTVGRSQVGSGQGSDVRDPTSDLERLVRCAARHADVCAVEIDRLAEHGLAPGLVATTVRDILLEEGSGAGHARGPARSLAVLRAGSSDAAAVHSVEIALEQAEDLLEAGWDGVVVEVRADLVATADYAVLVSSLGRLAGQHRP